MYLIKNAQTGSLIETSMAPKWMKQQKNVDFPIGCYSFDEADGLVLSDDRTMVGIEGRNMQNYTPTVIVEETSSDPYIFQQMMDMQDQINKVKNDVNKVENGVTEIYNVQTIGTVPKTDLDTAYKEGVNSYGE